MMNTFTMDLISALADKYGFKKDEAYTAFMDAVCNNTVRLSSSSQKASVVVPDDKTKSEDNTKSDDKTKSEDKSKGRPKKSKENTIENHEDSDSETEELNDVVKRMMELDNDNDMIDNSDIVEQKINSEHVCETELVEYSVSGDNSEAEAAAKKAEAEAEAKKAEEAAKKKAEEAAKKAEEAAKKKAEAEAKKAEAEAKKAEEAAKKKAEAEAKKAEEATRKAEEAAKKKAEAEAKKAEEATRKAEEAAKKKAEAEAKKAEEATRKAEEAAKKKAEAEAKKKSAAAEKGKSNKKVDATDVKKDTVETKKEETKSDIVMSDTVSDTDVVVDLTDEMKEENYISEEQEFDVEEFTYKGKLYLKCPTTNNIYDADANSSDEIGKWDEKTNTIHFTKKA